MTKTRNRKLPALSSQERLRFSADHARSAAHDMPPGAERDLLVRKHWKARQPPISTAGCRRPVCSGPNRRVRYPETGKSVTSRSVPVPCRKRLVALSSVASPKASSERPVTA